MPNHGQSYKRCSLTSIKNTATNCRLPSYHYLVPVCTSRALLRYLNYKNDISIQIENNNYIIDTIINCTDISDLLIESFLFYGQPEQLR